MARVIISLLAATLVGMQAANGNVVKEPRGNVFFTSVNRGNLSCPNECGQGLTVMTLSLPAGAYLVTGNLEVGPPNNGGATCLLSDSLGIISLPGQTASSDSFSDLPFVLSLQATAAYKSTVNVMLSCNWSGSSNGGTITGGPGTLSAVSVGTITNQ